ncbi:hypothetical protein B296_00048746 [Ensete ventricosum]|uniref:Uncharacterized protein n=1 Tax=Ensete ventricosum TaxID=4639 RepID=A0A426YTJ1_ENSVE|nr:hypothetical protein B296_00048746 [Ensete ventricosum]
MIFHMLAYCHNTNLSLLHEALTLVTPSKPACLSIHQRGLGMTDFFGETMKPLPFHRRNEESMLRAEWLEASANDAAAVASERHWVMAVQEKGLGWTSHQLLEHSRWNDISVRWGERERWGDGGWETAKRTRLVSFLPTWVVGNYYDGVSPTRHTESLAMFTRLRCKKPYHERVESTEDKLGGGGGGEAEMSRVPSIALTTALFHNFPSRVSAAAHEKWSGKRNRHAESTEEQVT